MAIRSRGSYNVEVKFEGNWFKFNEVVNSTNVLMAMAARQGQREFAEEYKNRLQKNIRTGGKRFGYQGLSPKYLAWKLNRNGPSSLLNWSGAFASSIEVRENRNGKRFMVGIPKGEKRPYYFSTDANKLTISEYANVLEHGTSNIPERPIFADTFSKDMGGKYALKKFIELSLIKRFGERGVIVTRI